MPTNNDIRISPNTILEFSNNLSDDERDALKYKLSPASVRELEDDFEISQDPIKSANFSTWLQCLHNIQPYRALVPEYGLAYMGRPDFLSDILLERLQTEAARFRLTARINFNQLISQVETPDSSTICEGLEASDELCNFVSTHAGPCHPSYVSTYIYYDEQGHCSRPHVDNAFTSITVMIALKHNITDSIRASSSVAYWPNRPRLDYQLKPGDMAIFYGASALHGRLPVNTGETVHSLLISFRPSHTI